MLNIIKIIIMWLTRKQVGMVLGSWDRVRKGGGRGAVGEEARMRG